VTLLLLDVADEDDVRLLPELLLVADELELVAELLLLFELDDVTDDDDVAELDEDEDCSSNWYETAAPMNWTSRVCTW